MALRQRTPETAIIDRIQQHRKTRKPAPPSREALSIVRGVVERSATIDDAIVAVKAVAAAWTGIGPATRDAVGLLIAILELSDSTEEALAVFSRLTPHYPIALRALADARSHIPSRLPGTKLRLAYGDEDPRLGLAFLKVSVPANDYASFKPLHDEFTDWWLDHHSEALGKIDLHPRRAIADV